MMLSALIIPIVLKTSVILAIAWGLVVTMAHGSAAAKQRVWATALLATLALPPLIVYGPAWSLPAPSWTAQIARLAEPSQGPLSRERNSAPASGRHPEYAIVLSPKLLSSILVQHYLSRLVVMVWSAVAAFGLLRLAIALIEAARMARRAHRISDPAWLALAEEAKCALRLPGEVVLARANVRMPLTWGIRRFVVLLPAEADEWSAERRRAVLFHEVAHVKRRDCLLRVCALIAAAVHWFNPLTHVAVRRLIAEQE